MAEQQRPSNADGAQAAEQTLLGEIQAEVPGEAAPLLTFVLSNMKVIVGGILLLVVATIGYGVWQWQDAKATRAAQIALGRILVQDNTETRVTALKTFLKDAPEAMRGAVLLELAASSVAAGDIAGAVEAYAALVKDNPGTALGMISAFNQSDLLLRLEKPKEALAVLESLQGVTPEALRPLVREQTASAAEQAGELQKALSLYEELLVPPAGGAARSETETAFFRSRIREITERLAVK